MASLFLNIGTGWLLLVSLTFRSPNPLKKRCRYPLNTKLDGHQICYGTFPMKKSFLALRGTESKISVVQSKDNHYTDYAIVALTATASC